MAEKYDLIVIGAGMAGISAATKCSSQGWRVAIVDALPYGGTCALRGCDPKKILRRGAEVIESARLMRGKGIDDDGLSVNWGDLMKHKRGFTDPTPQKMEDTLTGNGVTTLHGSAVFTNRHRLEIDGTAYEADKFLIATGARPLPLDFPGHEHLIDSTDFLELENCRRDVQPNTTITAIEKTSSGYRVPVERSGVQSRIDTDLIVHGAGRIPELAPLNLDAAGISASSRGVTVADHLQSTTNPVVYAAGDSADTPGMPLTPVAVFEGKVAASNMLKGTTTVPDYTGVPTTVFTIPELTKVGMLEQEARDSGIDLDVRYTDTGDWYSNYRIGETTGATKILIDRSNDHIVGAHMLGNNYGELINIVALAMKLDLTTRQLKSMVTTYPSIGSDLGSML